MIRLCKQLLARRRLAKWCKANRELMSSHQRASLKGWAQRREREGRSLKSAAPRKAGAC